MGIDVTTSAGVGFVVTDEQLLDYAKKHISEFNEDYAYIDEYSYDVAQLLSTPEIRLDDMFFGSMYDSSEDARALVLKRRSTSEDARRGDGGLSLNLSIFALEDREIAVLIDAMYALGVVDNGDKDGALIRISFLAGLRVS